MHSELVRILYAIETVYFSAGFETNGNTESGTEYDRLMGLYDENDLRGQDSDSGTQNSTTQLSGSSTYVHIRQSVVILVTQE